MTKNSISWRSGYLKEGELQELPERTYVEFALESGTITCRIKDGCLYVCADHGRLVVRPVVSNVINVSVEQ